MSSEAARTYIDRFRRVLAHVEAHLDDDLSLETLSSVAAFSKYHFHRQFAELFGVGVVEYVRLLRLRRASYRLAFRGERRILDLALDSGYESHEAFARAFKRRFGQTPSEFRERPHWDAWYATERRLTDVRNRHMDHENRTAPVAIVDFDETRVATLEHRGDPRLIGDSVRRFIEWRRANGVRPNVSATYNILYDDPEQTAPEEFRLDICAATDRAVAENPQGVVERTIPGGRCALLRHVGSDDTLGATIRYLYATWLPSSGEEPRDAPLFLRRVRFFPDVPEHEAVTDVYLPLR